ncbi:TIR domain-containing protein [Phototrophicus methaneseepsis]|uniref:TIR domain-containing protein n=1 Tax=Phototrophicus methaneseepsis TaxID=2710758 RepID=A0A7S8E909_9CHLR|nr:TIR domain-containing protein [Phototrophicus methaneseepsis]QPC82599.1 TIR domain-containing protein [Phototrophicus methaneseepsis]
MKVFISYSRSDAATVKDFVRDFQRIGIPIWLDVLDIPSGMHWSEKVQEGLDDCQVMVLFVSPKSMQSRQVAAEWQYFYSKNKPIIPVIIKPTENMNYRIYPLQNIDCVNQSYEEALTALLRDLRRYARGQAQMLTYPDAPPPPDFHLQDKRTLKLLPYNKHDVLSSQTKQTGRLDPSVVDNYRKVQSSSVLLSLTNASFTQQRLSVRLMPDNTYTIGRTEGDFQPHIDMTHFKATQFGVSREHAQFNILNHRLYIADLKSLNGTKINGRPIPPGPPYLLHDGDAIRLGGLELIVGFEFE